MLGGILKAWLVMGYEIDFRNEDGGAVKRLIWSTDLHFDAADKNQFKLYCDLVAAHNPDMILIGGDISNGTPSLGYLTSLANNFRKPIYFVFGNHDYYYGSIQKNRAEAHQLCGHINSLHYLTEAGVFALTKNTGLIGHDGWADGRAGDYHNSDVMLNDYFLISELNRLTHQGRFEKLNQLGNEAAAYLKKQLIEALKTYDRVIVLTHVPPFEESCLYEGQPADSNWLPHFVSKATGEVLEEVMKNHPTKSVLVLCGHSHWGHDIEILPNLRVVTGHSELGLPNVQGLILIN